MSVTQKYEATMILSPGTTDRIITESTMRAYKLSRLAFSLFLFYPPYYVNRSLSTQCRTNPTIGTDTSAGQNSFSHISRVAGTMAHAAGQSRSVGPERLTENLPVANCATAERVYKVFEAMRWLNTGPPPKAAPEAGPEPLQPFKESQTAPFIKHVAHTFRLQPHLLRALLMILCSHRNRTIDTATAQEQIMNMFSFDPETADLAKSFQIETYAPGDFVTVEETSITTYLGCVRDFYVGTPDMYRTFVWLLYTFTQETHLVGQLVLAVGILFADSPQLLHWFYTFVRRPVREEILIAVGLRDNCLALDINQMGSQTTFRFREAAKFYLANEVKAMLMLECLIDRITTSEGWTEDDKATFEADATIFFRYRQLMRVAFAKHIVGPWAPAGRSLNIELNLSPEQEATAHLHYTGFALT